MIQLESHFQKHGFRTNGVYRHERRSSFVKDRSILKKKKILRKTMLQVQGPSALFFEDFFSFSKSNNLFRRKIYVCVDRHRLFENHVFENVILIETIENVILYY